MTEYTGFESTYEELKLFSVQGAVSPTKTF